MSFFSPNLKAQPDLSKFNLLDFQDPTTKTGEVLYFVGPEGTEGVNYNDLSLALQDTETTLTRKFLIHPSRYSLDINVPSNISLVGLGKTLVEDEYTTKIKSLDDCVIIEGKPLIIDKENIDFVNLKFIGGVSSVTLWAENSNNINFFNNYFCYNNSYI